MKTINWSKANALVESYVKNLSAPNRPPTCFGRTWMEFEAEKVGMIQDARGWKFGESHAMWYAALIKTGRLHEVNRLEKRILHHDNTNGRITTLATANRLRKGRLRGTVTAIMLEAMLTQP